MNYRKCVSNFPSTWLANWQWLFSRPILARTQILVQRWKVVVFKPIILLKFSLPSCRWIFVVITWTRMLDGKANGCSQWFLSHRSVASGLEKPLLARWVCHRHLENLLNIPCCISTKPPLVPPSGSTRWKKSPRTLGFGFGTGSEVFELGVEFENWEWSFRICSHVFQFRVMFSNS